MKTKVTTVRHQTEILELQNAISRSLPELRQSQRIHMPGLTPFLDGVRDDDITEDSLKLWLPSELSAEERDSWCLPGIPGLEFRFRYAQADDSLAELRRLRRLFQNLKDQNSKHPGLVQRGRTRSQGLFNGFQKRIQRCADRYSHARNAMLALDADQKFNPGWMQRFKKLNESDIRGPGREIGDKSEGKFIPSWIWLVPRLTPPVPTLPRGPTTTISSTIDPGSGTITTSDENTTADDIEAADSMRVHWAKCQARAERYEEEVALTVEEMGRTLCYFKWKKSWWLSLRNERANSSTPPPADVQRGLHAYACRQANVYDNLITSFAGRWGKVLVSHKPRPGWLAQYPAANSESAAMDCESPHPSPPLSSNNESSSSQTRGQTAKMTLTTRRTLMLMIDCSLRVLFFVSRATDFCSLSTHPVYFSRVATSPGGGMKVFVCEPAE